MRTLAIALKDIKVTIRDKQAIIMVIVMPMILIGILGAALSNVFDKSSDVSLFTVAIVDQDRGSMARDIKEILNNKEIKKVVKSKEKSVTQAQKGIKNGEISAILIIPSGFTKDVMSGEKTKLQIIADPGKTTESGIFKGIIEGYANGASGVSIGVSTTEEQLAKSGVPLQVLPAMAPRIIGDLQSQAHSPKVEIKEETTSGNKQLTSMQYYSGAMGVMFMLFGAMLGIKSIMEERDNHTLMRIMSTSTRNSSIVTGKFLGIVGICVLQALVMIVLTSLVYGVHWGNSYLGILIMVLSMVFAGAGLSMFIAAVAKTARTADIVSSVGIQIMSILGGSMVPMHLFPAFLRKVGNLTINKWAIQGITDLMLDKGYQVVLQPSLILVSIGAVFLILGTWRLRLA